MQGVGYELHAMQSYLLTNISQHEKIQLYKTWKDEEKVMCTVITNSSIDKFISPKNIQPGRCIKLYTLRKINSTYINVFQRSNALFKNHSYEQSLFFMSYLITFWSPVKLYQLPFLKALVSVFLFKLFILP